MQRDLKTLPKSFVDLFRTCSAAKASSGAAPDAVASGSPSSASAHGRNAAPEGPQTTGTARGLGSNRQSFHPKVSAAQTNRREMRADQRAASAIYFKEYEKLKDAGASYEKLQDLPARGVGGCGMSQIAEMETLLQRGLIEEGVYKAFITGVRVCGLRWVCVHCAKKHAEEDRQAVNAGIAAARARGLKPVMLTLTTRHSRKDDACGLLKAIAQAEQRLKRLKVWTRLPVAGFARVLEWTYGKNGHHPHFHTILLVDASTEEEAVEQVKALQPAYMRQLIRAGRDGESEAAWAHSFQVQGAAAASSYITKWGAAEELTGAQHKVATHGFTQWQLLRMARTAKAEGKMTSQQARAFYGARWWEIMVAVKGRSQLFKSAGFTALAAEYLEAHPAEERPEPETVLSLGTPAKRGPQTEMWGRAAPSLLSVLETAERVQGLDAARDAVLSGLDGGHFPTDSELLGELVEPDEDLVESDDVDDVGDDVGHFCKSIVVDNHFGNTGAENAAILNTVSSMQQITANVIKPPD